MWWKEVSRGPNTAAETQVRAGSCSWMQDQTNMLYSEELFSLVMDTDQRNHLRTSENQGEFQLKK